MEQLHNPLNAQERFLYAIAIRLDAIIEQNNSIIEHLSKDGKVAVEEVKVASKTIQPKVEVKEEVAVKAPVKRTRKKVE